MENQSSIQDLNSEVGFYKEPFWSSLPFAHYYLEVLKDGVIIENIDIDKKPYYVFGRCSKSSDILLENPSISRRHAILQYKDTGEIYLYDLGTTHGSFIGKAKIKPFEYALLKVGSTFKFGTSTRMFVLNGPSNEEEEEDETEQNKEKSALKPLISKEELYQKRLEQIKKLNELREKDKITFKHNEEGTNWGFDEDAKEESGEDSSVDEEIELNSLQEILKLKQKEDLNPNQKKLIEEIEKISQNAEKLAKKISNMEEEDEKNMEEADNQKIRKINNLRNNLDDLTTKVNNKILFLKKTLIEKKDKDNEKEEEDNTKKIKEFYDAYEKDSDEEYYDRTVKRKGDKVSNQPIISYDKLKNKMDELVQKRTNLLEDFEKIKKREQEEKEKEIEKEKEKEKNNEKTSETQDALERYLDLANKEIKMKEKAKVIDEINNITEEINKINDEIKSFVPSFKKAEPEKPRNSNPNNQESTNEKKNAKKNLKNLKKTEFSMIDALKRVKEINTLKEENDNKTETEIGGIGIETKIPKSNNKEGPTIPPKEKKNSSNEKTEILFAAESEKPESSNENYFSEIIKNANKDKIDLNDYKIIKKKYEEHLKRKNELQEMRKIEVSLKPGLQIFELPNQKRSSTDANIIINDSKPNIKRAVAQGPTLQPLPRNRIETSLEDGELEEIVPYDKTINLN